MSKTIHIASAATGATPAPLHDIQHYLRDGPLRLRGQPPLSLYVHIPWCLRKCPYCDFNSHALREGDGAPEERYVDALISDLQAALPLVWGRSIISVFIGGGTPSLFSPQAIDRLLAAIRALLPLDAGCEITLEANPGTFEKERFRAYRDAGVTRLSIGVQSFNDRLLAAIGRVHDGAQAMAAVQEAAQAFETFNIDLMYALPGQSLAELEADVRQALDLGTPHLSVYHLTIEPNTWFAKHPPRLPDDDSAYAMLDRITALTAEAGMERYEVSAYAKAYHPCVHNSNYWQFGDYLGIGAGAHSKISFPHRVMRQVRFRDPQLYMQHALAGNAMAQDNEVAPQDLVFEYMLNALRLRAGFMVRDFSACTSQPITAISAGLKAAEAKGLLEHNLVRVRPTERGFDFLSDLQALFLPQ